MSSYKSTDERRWIAVVARDKRADGKFYYSVRTTGVYCLPSCPSRLARRENVAFHESPAAAERAGFRACKRCRPKDPPQSERNAALVARACRLIEQALAPPQLLRVASAVGLSRYHFHRIFKSVTGVTPKAYADAHRADRMRKALPASKTVTGAIYDAGFNSNGRFYAASPHVLGMTPGRYRAGGDRTVIRFAIGECSLGSILVAATDKGVCAILLGRDPEVLLRELEDWFAKAKLVGSDPNECHAGRQPHCIPNFPGAASDTRRI